MDCEICFFASKQAISSEQNKKTLISLVYFDDLCSMKSMNAPPLPPCSWTLHGWEANIVSLLRLTKRGEGLGGQCEGESYCTYCTILWIKQVLHVIRSPRTLDMWHWGTNEEAKKFTFIHIISCTSHQRFHEILCNHEHLYTLMHVLRYE